MLKNFLLLILLLSPLNFAAEGEHPSLCPTNMKEGGSEEALSLLYLQTLTQAGARTLCCEIKEDAIKRQHVFINNVKITPDNEIDFITKVREGNLTYQEAAEAFGETCAPDNLLKMEDAQVFDPEAESGDAPHTP